eukprot:1145836-Pelagomonas_calceolata.AAC.1
MALPLRPLSVHGAALSVLRGTHLHVIGVTKEDSTMKKHAISTLMRHIVLFPNSWMFFVRLEQLSRPSSQTT